MRPTGAVALLAVALTLAACAGDAATTVVETSGPAASPPASTVPPSTVPPPTPPSTTPASTTPASTTPPPTTPPPPTGDTAPVVVTDGEIVDPTRNRRIPYRMYTSAAASGPTPVILVSHGGFGSDTGYTRGEHLGSTFATHGFVALHVGHLPSEVDARQLTDRPADVSFVLDRMADGTIQLPPGAVADLERVGHTGHSFGAYTSHAVGGATYGQTFTDRRIDAIAPISPQGAGQFGAFDNGGADTTWQSVDIPAYDLVGGAEVDTNVIGTIDEPGWRLTPFERYPGTRDTFLTVLDGLDHQDMWNTGSDDVERFVAGAITQFFEVYVAGATDVDPCTIGRPWPEVSATTTRRVGSLDSRLVGCG